MLLAIDIGNTNVVLGILEGNKLTASFRLATRRDATADEIGATLLNLLQRDQIEVSRITRVILGSVVPPLTTAYEQACVRYFQREPLVVSHEIKLPIRIDIDLPQQIGADRIANAAAGYELFGGPVIIVDFGTATTFDIVSAEGAYIGGVISPGPETSMAELARKAARLFDVRIERPDKVVGKSTSAALKSGLFYGTVGQVDFIIERILDECKFEGCKVIATGGLAPGIEKHSRHIEQVIPDLTLQGLRVIAGE
ncbi:MAG: type III pantothenate kinase [candidate division Zixibacteria bacterium]|nr:type III pantothenate kinase [candidate division Zixibacteria bacterium]